MVESEGTVLSIGAEGLRASQSGPGRVRSSSEFGPLGTVGNAARARATRTGREKVLPTIFTPSRARVICTL